VVNTTSVSYMLRLVFCENGYTAITLFFGLKTNNDGTLIRIKIECLLALLVLWFLEGK
jgi:hypothetical protein